MHEYLRLKLDVAKQETLFLFMGLQSPEKRFDIIRNNALSASSAITRNFDISGRLNLTENQERLFQLHIAGYYLTAKIQKDNQSIRDDESLSHFFLDSSIVNARIAALQQERCDVILAFADEAVTLEEDTPLHGEILTASKEIFYAIWDGNAQSANDFDNVHAIIDTYVPVFTKV